VLMLRGMKERAGSRLVWHEASSTVTASRQLAGTGTIGSNPDWRIHNTLLLLKSTPSIYVQAHAFALY
jgi:hypothetical protein